ALAANRGDGLRDRRVAAGAGDAADHPGEEDRLDGDERPHEDALLLARLLCRGRQGGGGVDGGHWDGPFFLLVGGRHPRAAVSAPTPLIGSLSALPGWAVYRSLSAVTLPPVIAADTFVVRPCMRYSMLSLYDM